MSVLFLHSCAIYQSEFKIVNKHAEVDNSEPLYIIDEEDADLPENSIYIGEFHKYTIGARLYWGYDYPSELNNMHSIIKEQGANCLVLKDKPYKNPKNVIEGKLYFIKPNLEHLDYTETSLLEKWKSQKPDQFEGIYEKEFGYLNDEYRFEKLKYAVVKVDADTYKMIYLSGISSLPRYYGLDDLHLLWKEGDVRASLKKTEVNNVFKSTRFSLGKNINYNERVKFENGNLKMFFSDGMWSHNKIFPDSSSVEKIKGTLTGFAVDKNTIITCYHGFHTIQHKIFVKGLNGDFNKAYKANLYKYDKENDIAVLKLEDSNAIQNFSPLPFANKELSLADDVFVLGYPMSNVMGEEIKLTDGIVSSTSGHAEDPTAYQISAPIQPGNSGSPLFDKNANVLGMVYSQISGSDNVGYALKLKYLNNFLAKNSISINKQNENSYKDLSYLDKINKVKNSILLIEIHDVPIEFKEADEETASNEKPIQQQKRMGR